MKMTIPSPVIFTPHLKHQITFKKSDGPLVLNKTNTPLDIIIDLVPNYIRHITKYTTSRYAPTFRLMKLKTVWEWTITESILIEDISGGRYEISFDISKKDALYIKGMIIGPQPKRGNE